MDLKAIFFKIRNVVLIVIDFIDINWNYYNSKEPILIKEQ